MIGPNGAGKSTTLHAIMGVVAAREGDDPARRHVARGRAPEDVARSGVALVPEGRRIFAELTVEENLRLGLAGRRSAEGASDDVDGRLRAVPGRAGVPAPARRAPSPAGSSSNSRSPARSSRAPDVLLLDEPSLGLVADRRRRRLRGARSAIRERGITVLLVEQRAQRTVALADRSYVIANGEPSDYAHAGRRRTTPTKMVAAYLS